jgi:hypothetical protein
MGDSLERRVLAAANAALARNKFVAPIDVLTGLGWLRKENADATVTRGAQSAGQ